MKLLLLAAIMAAFALIGCSDRTPLDQIATATPEEYAKIHGEPRISQIQLMQSVYDLRYCVKQGRIAQETITDLLNEMMARGATKDKIISPRIDSLINPGTVHADRDFYAAAVYAGLITEYEPRIVEFYNRTQRLARSATCSVEPFGTPADNLYAPDTNTPADDPKPSP